ncbi:glyoxylate/hydroxypyruvate reductase A [Belliella buryatensis]|uniref:Glyoxylate/hydroxypyruvate reductase A n=1 Tax=Belliella buryatensis TaxID=1500549 RepID=A0A239C420_9BACT|nr:glyoxylate/hydroxypyruvate reductase A [Belliella buryatensis]SNS14381.1 glyoxylate/hydroxypyruvate reductase A [Belliella buryatensis]
MGLAIISPGRDPEVWIENIKMLDADIDIQVYPNIDRKDDVEAVMLWNHPKGILNEFPNLKLICSMGAGVDHILSDDSIPSHLPITRIIDDKLTISMTNYVVMGVLNYHRQFIRYQNQKVKKIWDMSSPEIEINVGVLGVGELGGDVIDKLRLMKFNVAGYGNSPKRDLKYPYFHGDQLDDFLKQVNMIICLLPLTPQTENFLNKDFFNKCKPGTYIINVARGKHLVESDLLEAIEEDQISGAMLDVFLEEPLPIEHPFWGNDRIMVTPHIASVTNPSAAAPQIVNNYHRLLNQKPLINVIDRNRGY